MEAVGIGLTGAVLAAALIGFVAQEGAARANGREVALAIAPLGSDDILGEGYIDLEFRDALPPGAACPPGTRSTLTGSFEGMALGWVALQRSGGSWRVAGTARTRADALAHGPVVVRGWASCAGDGVVDLAIGPSRFHPSRKEAQALAAVLDRRGVGGGGRDQALVSIGDDGRARLKGLQLDGSPVELDWF